MSTTTAVFGDVLVVSIKDMYDYDDLDIIMGLIYGNGLDNINHILVDCKEWDWYNTLGGEFWGLQEKLRNKKNNLVFCGMSNKLRTTIDMMVEECEEFNPVFLESLNEGFEYVKK